MLFLPGTVKEMKTRRAASLAVICILQPLFDTCRLHVHFRNILTEIKKAGGKHPLPLFENLLPTLVID
jgi:hypothetical protein